MNCGYTYCIYNKENKCLLNEISLNDSGMCEERIIVPLNDEALEQLKERAHQELEKLY